jgi:hypothetical protein
MRPSKSDVHIKIRSSYGFYQKKEKILSNTISSRLAWMDSSPTFAGRFPEKTAYTLVFPKEGARERPDEGKCDSLRPLFFSSLPERRFEVCALVPLLGVIFLNFSQALHYTENRIGCPPARSSFLFVL